LTGLKEDISWGSSQLLKICFFNKNEGKDVEILFKSQILNMFRMYEKERKISILIVICDSDGSSKCSGTNTHFSCTPSQPPPIFDSQVESSQVGDHDVYVGFNEEHTYDLDGENSFFS
jgi:hypothetical protein